MNSDSKFPFRFNTQDVLVAMAILAVLLAGIKTMPARSSRFVGGILIVATMSAVTFVLLTVLDRTLSSDEPPKAVPLGSLLSIASSAAIISLVLGVSALQLPGRVGTVQLHAGDPLAMFVFDLRGVAALTMMISPIACGAIGLMTGKGRPFRYGWHVVAIGGYILALVVMGSHSFFPLV